MTADATELFEITAVLIKRNLEDDGCRPTCACDRWCHDPAGGPRLLDGSSVCAHRGRISTAGSSLSSKVSSLQAFPPIPQRRRCSFILQVSTGVAEKTRHAYVLTTPALFRATAGFYLERGTGVIGTASASVLVVFAMRVMMLAILFGLSATAGLDRLYGLDRL